MRNQKRWDGNIKTDVKDVQDTGSPGLVQSTVNWQVLVKMTTNLLSLIQRVGNFLTGLLHVLFDLWNIGHS